MDDAKTIATKRTVCNRCQRPLRACYCAALPPIPLHTQRTSVIVLQHIKEQRQRQSISSVPVLTQVLTSPTSIDVVPVSIDASSSETNALCATLQGKLNHVLLADTVEAVLVLFPNADAKALTTELVVAPDPPRTVANETDKTVVLVVVDGTWTEAKKIVYHSQRYWEAIARDCRTRDKVFEYVCLDETSLEGATTSIYGELRKEPMEGCVSTLEAVAIALRVLEPKSNAVCDALCQAFQGMVDIQTAFLRQGKTEQQARHGGTPKPAQTNRPREDTSATERRESTGRGVIKRYVFYTTHTDVRKRQRLVQEGDVHVCTRDEAIAHCKELNRDRKRGNRVSTLPEEAFHRQQLQHQDEETQS